jgi:hypothetical protein
MNTDTGEIKREDEIPTKEKKKYIPIKGASALKRLSALSASERVDLLRRDREKGSSSLFDLNYGSSGAARKKKRKSQRMARRKNR